jgi:hypothetical protein
MSKIRNLNPKPLRDQDVMSMTWPAIVIWAYLPCFADRNGRLKYDINDFKLNLMPLKDIDIDGVLQELEDKKHILKYTVNDNDYIQIRNFKKYQKPYPGEPIGNIPPSPTEISSSDYEFPPFGEDSWSIALGVWESAGTYRTLKGQLENFKGAKRVFQEKINSTNWDEFIEKLDWKITESRTEDRKWLGLFVTFIDDEKWKDVASPGENKKTYQETKTARLNARWD